MSDPFEPAAGLRAIYRIARLGAGDLELMRAVNRLFAVAFNERQTYEAAPPGDDWLAGALARETTIALAAVSPDGEPLGALVAYELDKLEQARREIYIYDLAVAEPHRRCGIATALIARVQAIAAARGAWVIFVQGDYGDEAALALYGKLGAEEKVLHFDIAPAGGALTLEH